MSKNDKRKIYMIEATSTFRIKYAVYAANEVDAIKEYESRTNELTEFSQLHIGEELFSCRKLTEKQYLKMFDKDNDYIASWHDDHKLSSINVIDYEDKK